MIPVFILVGVSVLLRGIGWLGVQALQSWQVAGRLSLVILFLFTGVTHFSSMKYDYAAMIPAPLPKDLWLVYLTGLLEIAGAIGLLIPRTRWIAAVCLILLLLAMFPANINATLHEIPFRGRAATPLWIRTPLQLFFIGMVWWSSIRGSELARSHHE